MCSNLTLCLSVQLEKLFYFLLLNKMSDYHLERGVEANELPLNDLLESSQYFSGKRIRTCFIQFLKFPFWRNEDNFRLRFQNLIDRAAKSPIETFRTLKGSLGETASLIRLVSNCLSKKLLHSLFRFCLESQANCLNF